MNTIQYDYMYYCYVQHSLYIKHHNKHHTTLYSKQYSVNTTQMY